VWKMTGKLYRKQKKLKSKRKMKNPIYQMMKKDKKFGKIINEINQEGVTNGGGIYLFGITTSMPKEWEKLSKEEIADRQEYFSICSREEVERIYSPNNSADILLKSRADSILDNIRLRRVFSKRASLVEEDKWTLTNQFNDSIFDDFTNSISPEYKKRINEVQFGTLFTDRPNAYCIKTQFTPLIIFSEALYTYFFYLAICEAGHWQEFGEIISVDTEKHALLIAVRTMFLTESFDFEIDPRGKPPEPLNGFIEGIVRQEMQFVIAHEYAHYLLKHLDERKLKDENFALEFTDDKKTETKHLILPFYSVDQQQEFEADRLAIDMLSGSSQSKGQVLLFSLSALMKIRLFETLANFRRKRTESTHPASSDRCQELLKLTKGIWDDKELATFNNLERLVKQYEKMLIELFKKDQHVFTFYGSLYIRQWKKGKMKIDRIDF
jgi:hypothetical protein